MGNSPKIIGEIPNICDTLWLCNIAMENSPFIDGLPIKNGDFPWLC
jgi:hypothetical protein